MVKHFFSEAYDCGGEATKDRFEFIDLGEEPILLTSPLEEPHAKKMKGGAKGP